jgi:phytanoyl-CoA hydroxylase
VYRTATPVYPARVFEPYRPEALRDAPAFSYRPLAGTRPLRVATPEQVRAFDEQGFFVWEDAFDRERIAALVRDLDEEIERAAGHVAKAGGKLFISESDGILFAPHAVLRSNVARSFAADPRVAGLCADLMGPDVRLYWDQAVYKYPSYPKLFPWHQDNGYTYLEPQLYLTLWLALVDVTPETGCVEVVPGSHKGGTRRHRYSDAGFYCHEGDDGVRVPLRAGSAAVFSSLTVHRTGPNTTLDRVRRAYIMQYAPDGAVRYPREGPVEPCDVPERQFFVLRNGEPVAPEPLES